LALLPRANPTLPPIPQEQKILQIFRRRMMQDHHCTTAAGKTTLPSILAGFVPEDERIVLIEDRPRIHQSEKRAAVRGETSSKDARTVADLYPDVVNAELEEVQRRRGLETQEPFVNTTLANHSLSLLCALVPLRYDRTSRGLRELDDRPHHAVKDRPRDVAPHSEAQEGQQCGYEQISGWQ
jgi:hypothetical protein